MPAWPEEFVDDDTVNSGFNPVGGSPIGVVTDGSDELVLTGARYRSGDVEDSLRAIRDSILKGQVKQEAETVETGTMAPQCLDPQQVQLIRDMKRGANKFDPAQYPEAASTWQHRMRELDVGSLLQTHQEVSATFLHGPHHGESVRGLTEKLLSGRVRPCEITPLVVVKFLAQNWVVFGNRRLKALKDYQMNVGHVVVMHCILHDLDSTLEAPYPLVAKLFDAAETRNGGVQAFFRQRKRRRY